MTTNREPATMFGPVYLCGPEPRPCAADPEVVIAEDGQTVLLTDPADDPSWRVWFCLPVWAAFDGDTVDVRVSADWRCLSVTREPGGRPEVFQIPSPVRRDLLSRGLIVVEDA